MFENISFKIILLAAVLYHTGSIFPEVNNGELIDMKEKENSFKKIINFAWKKKFSDSCTENWQDKWFLDGQKATVKNTVGGMIFAAGAEPGDNASHAVLWTRDSFCGDIKIEWDFI